MTSIEEMKIWWPDWQPGGLLEPSEGGRIVLGDGSWIDGTIKVWAPPNLLEFTWKEAPEDADWFEPGTKSLLRVELVALAQQRTALTLIQFAPAAAIVGGTAGWHYFAGERLKCLVEGGTFDDRPERFDELVALYTSDESAV